MPTVDEGIQAQLRNIERATGRTIAEWTQVIAASGLGKHTEIVALLKADHGLAHGAAHRLSIVAREAISGTGSAAPAEAGGDAPAAPDPADGLYAGKKSALRPIHDAVLAVFREVAGEVEQAPKKGYVSLRRKKQFAMLQPGATWVNLGLILRGVPVSARLESAEGFNALFTHRVRLTSVTDVDGEVVGWLRAAWEGAG